MGDDNELPPVLTDMHMRQVIYFTSAIFFNYFCSTAPYPEGVDTATARALTADCTRTRERSAGDPAYMNAFVAFKSFNDASLEMVLLKSVEPDSEEARLLDEAWPYQSASQDVHKGRMICVTKGRYMGVTAYDTEKGDLPVMLKGSFMPFVLRPKDEDFMITGSCYIHDIMDGELACVPEANFELNRSQCGVDKRGNDFCIRSLIGRYAIF